MQREQRFVADQRFDLPQYESVIQYISAEFYNYNKRFFSPENRIVKNWKIENNGGLSIRVNNTAASLLFNSERVGFEAINARDALADQLTLTLADGATNYVELQITGGTCAPDIVAIWDSLANGTNGEEFTQTVDTVIEQKPVLISNTVAFSGDPDKIRLAIVTTAGGVITNIQDERKTLFELNTDWNFGLPRTDRTIDSFKAAFDAIATSIKEIKGSTNWYDLPFAGISTLKEYQNMFFTGGGTISWEGANGPNNLKWTSAINIFIADRPYTYVIDSVVSVALLDGQCLYVDIPAGSPPGSLTPVVANIEDVPINPASVGYSSRIQTIFFRKSGKIYGMMDIPELDSGESAIVGEDLPKDIRTRLGITSETVYEAYTSTTVVLPADSYATAISKLDAAINAIATDEAKEEWQTVVGVPQTIFNIVGFTFVNDNTKPDIVVTVNGVKVKLATDGTSATGEYKKNSTSQIEFFTAINVNGRVCVRDERSGAGISGGGVDLTNIAVDPQPLTNGSQALGTVAKAWDSIFLKDTTSSQVYQIEIVSGVFQITAVP